MFNLEFGTDRYVAVTFISVWQVLDRGEKIELLVDKTENLRSQVCWMLLSHIKKFIALL